MSAFKSLQVKQLHLPPGGHGTPCPYPAVRKKECVFDTPFRGRRGHWLQRCNRRARFRQQCSGNVPVFTHLQGTLANFASENDNNNTKNNNDMEFYDEYYDEYDNDFGSSYGRYAGSYAQDIEGYDDETIDEAFDGDPEAYWNID